MISERLVKAAELVENADTVIDVGTDHCYVPVLLIREKRANLVYATDINEGPIKAARANIEKYKMENRIKTRLGDGLNAAAGIRADTAVIAGMGGALIRDILIDGKDTAEQIESFVLQPMNQQECLRSFLLENGYVIEFETLCKEKNKIYNIIKASHGVMPPYEKEIFYYTGRDFKNVSKELLREYFLRKKNQLEKVVDGLNRAAGGVLNEKIKYEGLLRSLEEVISDGKMF